MQDSKIEINLSVPFLSGDSDKEYDLIIVNSHERSGTHFLMNTLDHTFKIYSAKPFLNFDLVPFSSVINFYSEESLGGFFKDLIKKKNISIIKSHFHSDFFVNLNNLLLQKIKFFFIYRNPIDALKSFWIFLHNCDWYEGPKIQNFNEFCFSKPAGQLLRYQSGQCENFIDRYFEMLSGWNKFSKLNKNVFLISYESLNKEFNNSQKKIGEFLNLKIKNNSRFERSSYQEIKMNNFSDKLLFDENNLESIKKYINEIIKERKLRNLFLNNNI